MAGIKFILMFVALIFLGYGIGHFWSYGIILIDEIEVNRTIGEREWLNKQK